MTPSLSVSQLESPKWGTPPPIDCRWHQDSRVRKIALIAFTVLAAIATLAALYAAFLFVAAPLAVASLFYTSAIVAGLSTVTSIVLACLKPHPNDPTERKRLWEKAERDITAWVERKSTNSTTASSKTATSKFFELRGNYPLVSDEKWGQLLAPYAKKLSYKQFVDQFSQAAFFLLSEENRAPLRLSAAKSLLQEVIATNDSLQDIVKRLSANDLYFRFTVKELREAALQLKIEEIKNKRNPSFSTQQDVELIQYYQSDSFKTFRDNLQSEDQKIIRSLALKTFAKESLRLKSGFIFTTAFASARVKFFEISALELRTVILQAREEQVKLDKNLKKWIPADEELVTYYPKKDHRINSFFLALYIDHIKESYSKGLSQAPAITRKGYLLFGLNLLEHIPAPLKEDIAPLFSSPALAEGFASDYLSPYYDQSLWDLTPAHKKGLDLLFKENILTPDTLVRPPSSSSPITIREFVTGQLLFYTFSNAISKAPILKFFLDLRCIDASPFACKTLLKNRTELESLLESKKQIIETTKQSLPFSQSSQKDLEKERKNIETTLEIFEQLSKLQEAHE